MVSIDCPKVAILLPGVHPNLGCGGFPLTSISAGSYDRNGDPQQQEAAALLSLVLYDMYAP
jgi:hypothetical protein